MLQISPEEIIERLKQENVWWADGMVDLDYRDLKRRAFFSKFYSLVADKKLRRAVVLMGPRRVGKTVLMFQAIAQLIVDGVNPKRILYASLDNPFYNNVALEQLLAYGKQATGQEGQDGWYLFFDEVQQLKGWELHMKALVDAYRRSKFIVSGSAAAALKAKSNESGAGRFTDFLLPPLTFHEFLDLQNLNDLIIPAKEFDAITGLPLFSTIDIGQLNDKFIDYINYGGYPEIIFSDRQKLNPFRFIKHDIIDKVLLRDLPVLYGVTDVQELNGLFTAIAYNSGQEFSLEALSKTSGGIKKDTVRKYIEYLEAAYLIKIVHRMDHNARKFERAVTFKIYLTNPSLRTAIFRPVRPTDADAGPMVETTAFSQWLRMHDFGVWYARWNEGRKSGEVDMVRLKPEIFKPDWVAEFKWSDRYFHHPNELESLLSFCKKNDLSQAMCTTIGLAGVKDFGGVTIRYLPSALFTYAMGRHTIENLD